MMKKFLVFSTCLLMLGLMTGPASAQIGYSKDVLEPGNPGGSSSLKTFDETWEMNQGATIEMDIWLNDAPDSMLTAGFYITYNTALINIVNVVPNDTNNGGQWDGSGTLNFEFEPGVWILQLLNFSCVAPDGDGDIFLGRVTFQCQGEGEVDVEIQTIPAVETVVGCSTPVYDAQISPNLVTITQTSGAVCTVPGDCPDDGNLCTEADCVGGTCVYNPVVCNDDNPCTVDTCNASTGNCDFTPVNCDDGIDCTIDSCEELTGDCVNTPDDTLCDDGDLCTNDECNLVSGCSSTPVDCDDGIGCTNDSCDPGTGECLNEPDDTLCDDGADCTDDTCDPVAGCQYEDNCESGFFCNKQVEPPACEESNCSIALSPPRPRVDVLGTVQFDVAVDSTGACINEPSYTWNISDTGCIGDATGSALGSTINANGLYTAGDKAGTDIVTVTDENNGDACASTEVIVREGSTPPLPPPSGCTSNYDCIDDVFCDGEETCVNGKCVAGTPPCPAELCDEETDTCLGCLVDEDCDDGVDCTDDSCVDEICENTPNDENCPDDGLYCNGEEFCDEAEGCSSTGNPCEANETCDEGTDSCVVAGACTINVLADSLPKSSWWVFWPALFRIETTGIEDLSIATPVNVECESDGMGSFGPAIRKLIAYPLPSFGTNTRVILYIGITFPAILTGSQDMQTETCTVTVGDCAATDTFELNYLPFPLSE